MSAREDAFVFDSWTTQHLERWVQQNYPDEVQATLDRILSFLAMCDLDEQARLVNEGWPTVDRHARGV